MDEDTHVALDHLNYKVALIEHCYEKITEWQKQPVVDCKTVHKKSICNRADVTDDNRK